MTERQPSGHKHKHFQGTSVNGGGMYPPEYECGELFIENSATLYNLV